MESKETSQHFEMVSNFIAIANRLEANQFVARFDHPFLVHEGGQEDARKAAQFGTMILSPGKPMQESMDDLDRKQRRVFRVVKKKGSAVDLMITVGRSGNNDIRILDPLVSKLHAYFQKMDDGSYILCDNLSTNGTTVNGQELPAKEKRPMQDGDRLSFGGEEEFMYYTSQGFYDLLTKLQ